MAHYAYLDENNIVTAVIVGREEGDAGTDWEAYYAAQAGLPASRVKQTSYNTAGNVHALGGTPFRKNYAGIGHEYRADIDGFVAPKPFPSWSLNSTAGLWEPPVPMPSDGGPWQWDEDAGEWTP
jgi:hypothetical protein